MSDTELNTFINNFYMYDMPERLKTLKLETMRSFVTTPNIDTYDLAAVTGTEIYDVKTPVYVAGYQVSYHQNPEQFYRIWPWLRYRVILGVGTGVANYTFTLPAIPALRNSVLISAGALAVSDDGLGGFTGDIAPLPAVNTINYVTGVVTVTFNAVIPVTTNIYAQFWPYVASRPRDVMFFNNQFVFRPVPDIPYEVQFVALQTPTALAAGGSPEFLEWWQLISYGAALKIFVEQSDMEQYAQLYPVFQEQVNLAMRRSLKQLATQRVQTAYGENNNMNGIQFPIYPLY
jgi:hypothetical protein